MAKVVEYILDIKSGKATKGLKKMGNAADRAEGKLKKTKKSGLKMASQMGNAMTGLAVGIGVAAAGLGTLFRAIEDTVKASAKLTREVIDSVNNLNDLNARSGLTAASIQALGAAFVASGQEASKAESFVSRFPKIYTDLSTEGTKASDAARQLGISVRNNDGTMKNSDELLINITKSLQSIDNDTERATAGFTILGRAGADFLQALGKTSSFESFLTLTEKFGVKTTPEASAAAAEWQATLSAVQTVIAGLKQDFVNAAGGVGIFNGFLRKTIVVTVALQEMIGENQEAFAMMGRNMAMMGEGLFELFKNLTGAFIGMMADYIQHWAVQYAAIALALHHIGAITDDTLESSMKVLGGAAGSAEGARNIGGAFTEMDFEKSKGAQEALEALDEILAGLDGSLKTTTFNMDDLKDTIDATGESAGKTAAMVRGAEGQAHDRQLEQIESFIASTRESFDTLHMTGLEKELHALDSVIATLTDSLEFLDYYAYSKEFTEAEELIAAAMEEQIRLTREASGAINSFNDDLQQLGNLAVGMVESISSPEGMIRGLEQIPVLLDAVSGMAAKGSSALIDVAMGGGKKAVTVAASKGVGALSSIAGGAAAAAGTAAAAAPIVGAIGLVAVALAKLGESTEAEINAKFDSFMVNFEKGIDLLPEILKKVLPEFIAQLTKVLLIDLTKLIILDLPIAIVAAIPMLIIELVQEIILLIADIFKGIVRTIEGITSFIDRLKEDGIKGLFDAFRKAVEDQLFRNKEWLQDAFAMRGGGRFIPAAAGGIRFTGAEQGLAMLHRGETVVPESNVTSQAVNRRIDRSMGGGLNIIINADIIEGSAVDALVRKIEQRFGEFGAATSTLFGGA